MAKFKALGAGNGVSPSDDIQIDSLGVGCTPSGVSGEAKISTILPCDDSTLVKVQLPPDSTQATIFGAYNKNGTLCGYINANGDIKAAGSLYAGPNKSAYVSNYYAGSTSSDWKAVLLSDSYGFAFQNTSGSDAFRLDLDGDDRVMSFIGGTNTGTLTWDDSASTFDFSDPIKVAPVAATPSAPSSGATLYCDSADGNLKVIFSDGNIVTIATNP